MRDIGQRFKYEPGYAKIQVPIQQAQARYAEFLQIWQDLTTWSETLKNHNSSPN